MDTKIIIISKIVYISLKNGDLGTNTKIILKLYTLIDIKFNTVYV